MHEKNLIENFLSLQKVDPVGSAMGDSGNRGKDACKEKNSRLFNDFQLLIKGISDPLLNVDSQLNVVWMNEAAERMRKRAISDATSEEAIIPCYRLWFDASDKYDFPAVRRAFATGLQQEEIFEDGHQRTWGLKVFSPVTNEAGDQTALIMASDITEKFMLRSEAMRTSQMAMLTHLAAGVAHEINNPVNGIINYAQLAADRFSTDNDERTWVKEIIREGTRIAAIVNNLLLFARDPHEQRTEIAPEDLIDDVLSLAKSRLAGDHICLKLHLSDRLPCILGQRVQLQQMILNVISNARQALNRKFPARTGHKTLVIKAKPIDNEKSSLVRLEFIDNGAGIESDCLEKIFDPIYSTAAAEKRQGLGLSVSRGIAKNHGGDIRISSKAGKFTRVEVDLPASDGNRGGKDVN